VIKGRGTGGPSNWNSVGKEKARQALEEAILNSIKDAKTSIQNGSINITKY
jgi:N-acetylglucosamine kinase-like BadF-type ATPase